ncbi:hypothetical protein GCM10023116_17050 [Kistimonas scapharcae]|uniref:DUF3108 domain-containing protein n=1 Tax=Kistimonas scapharcae TaxID=1036133 RepID=A0ABP8V2I6_9GAMM
MTRLSVLSLCLLSLLMAWQANAGLPASVIGRAYDLEGAVLLYTEEHLYPSPYRHTVTYREASGEVFAKKRLDYTHSFTVPDFRQENARNGEVIKVARMGSDKLEVTYQANDKQKPKQKRVAIESLMVVDAGFDHFVREHWETLRKGRSLTIAYLAPSRRQTVALRINEVPCSSSSDVCFNIAPDSWLLGLVLDPIFLTYEKETKQLLRFRGRGNIADKKGDYQTVDIRYEYPVE